jgi:prepilin-type N-terminal cleavage/methylation domain-containing protein
LSSAITENRRASGFTLTELAVVLTIASLLLMSLMYTLSAQSEQRARETTQRRLEEAKELLLAFAIVNRRLPCPAAAPPRAPYNNGGGTGTESPAGGACTDSYSGFLPGRALGFGPVDDAGYALDAWGNPIRYAVSSTTWSAGAGRFTTSHSTTAWIVSQNPADLLVCTAWGGSTTTCGTATQVTNQNTIVAVVWSQGKNFSQRAAGGIGSGGGGADETANNKHRLPSAQNNHPVFVWHEPRPTGATGGEYDDLVTWIPVGLLYGQLVSAGVLP